MAHQIHPVRRPKTDIPRATNSSFETHGRLANAEINTNTDLLEKLAALKPRLLASPRGSSYQVQGVALIRELSRLLDAEQRGLPVWRLSLRERQDEPAKAVENAVNFLRKIPPRNL